MSNHASSEAQAMARLSHPNVVTVHEVGTFEEQVFVAMEFVVGPTLAEWTRAQARAPGRWRTILSKYIDVGRGLGAAHDVRLVHRDFKPSNVLVGHDGVVRVADAAIATVGMSSTRTSTSGQHRQCPHDTRHNSTIYD